MSILFVISVPLLTCAMCIVTHYVHNGHASLGFELPGLKKRDDVIQP